MINLEEVRKVVDQCDVFTVGFRIFPQRLIIDTRSSGEEGPMIEIVEPVSTVEERFFWLGKRRPAFEVPQRFTFFIWPHSIRYFRESGLADMIRNRLAAERPEAADAIDRVLPNLERLERRATIDAITGRNYHTLWPTE